MAVKAQLEHAILALAVSLGVLGNIAVVVCICRKRSLLKNRHYYLILLLAICDLFYLLFFAPFAYSNFPTDPFITSRIMCKTWWPVHTSFYIAGANFLVLISIIRYRTILHPLKPPVSWRALKISSIFTCVLAIVCVIPYALVLRYNETNFTCHEEWTMKSLNIAYTVSLTCVQYFVPVLFMSTNYYKICQQLITRNNWIGNQVQQTNGRASTWFQSLKGRNRKTFLVSFTIVICFVLFACPIQIAWIVSVISSNESSSYYNFFNALNIFGTAVLNPFVYGVLDANKFSFFKHCRRRVF